MIRFRLYVDEDHKVPYLNRDDVVVFLENATKEESIEYIKHVEKLIPMSLSKEETMSELCDSCNKKPAEELHTCPYAEEISDDCESLCNCCDDCTHECCMDI